MPPGPEDVFGPMLLGLLFDAVFLGVLAIQVWGYFYRYRRDRWWFKLLVAYLFIADITNTACDFATVWEPLIQNWGKLQVLGQSPRFLPADPVTTTLISTPVQLFMAWRVKIITKSNILPIIIALCSLVSLGGGAWLSFNIFSDTFEGSHNSMTKNSSSTWLISSAVTDILITVAIVRIMITRRNGADANLNNHLARIMRLTVEAGAITTLAVISTLIVFLSVRQGPYFLIWDFSISKLYSISLIVSLNARPLRDRFLQERPALFLDTSKNTNTSGGSIPSAINSSNESELFPRSDNSYQYPPRSSSLSPRGNRVAFGGFPRHERDDSGATMVVQVGRGEQFAMQPMPVKF